MGKQTKVHVYHIGDVKWATYEVISGATDAETDRAKMAKEFDRRCHETDEPLSFNTVEEDSQEGDKTPELIETDDEDENDEPE